MGGRGHVFRSLPRATIKVVSSRRRIRSVSTEVYPNLEYIVIDGGSTDDSVEIIKKYALWLTRWISEPDKGQAHAINKGFAAVTGDILGFINSDDQLAEGVLHEVARCWCAARRPRYALICGAWENMNEGNALVTTWRPMQLWGLKDWLYGKATLHQPGCFWTREIWKRYGPFRQSLHFIFDRYFFAKIAAENKLHFLISEALFAHHRLHRVNEA